MHNGSSYDSMYAYQTGIFFVFDQLSDWNICSSELWSATLNRGIIGEMLKCIWKNVSSFECVF